MVIPRSWSGIKKQNTEWQIEHLAQPAATSTRDKTGALLAFCAWTVICYSLWHSLKHYKKGLWTACPPKLATAILLLAMRLGYGIASAWNWNLSIAKVGVQLQWPFGFGYAPILLILIVFEVAGIFEENEDKILMNQRTARGRMHDAELNIIRKPTWWQKNVKDRYLSDEQRLKKITTEIQGGRASTQHTEPDVEMRSLSAEAGSAPANPFRDAPPDTRGGHAQSETSSTRTDTTLKSDSIDSRGTVATSSQQQIRSMLDV